MGNCKVILSVGIVLAVLALVSVVYAQVPIVTCSDPNEYFDDCGPVCGDRSCANKNKNDVSCLRSCIEGCFCKGGYVRSKTYRCVPSYLCLALG